MFGRELIAVDGTRIKAVNSRERNFTKAKLAKAMAESDERLARYLKQLDEADKDGEDAPERGTVERVQEKIAASKFWEQGPGKGCSFRKSWKRV